MIAMWIGFQLTLWGMGLVFLLLAVLWWLIALFVHFDQAPAAPEPADADGGGEASSASIVALSNAEGQSGPSDELLAAIVVACRAHRMTRRKQAAPEMRTHEPGSLPSRWIGSGRTRQNRSWAPGGRFA